MNYEKGSKLIEKLTKVKKWFNKKSIHKTAKKKNVLKNHFS